MKPVYKMRPKKTESGKVADEWESYVDSYVIDEDDEDDWEDDGQAEGGEAVDAAVEGGAEGLPTEDLYDVDGNLVQQAGVPRELTLQANEAPEDRHFLFRRPSRRRAISRGASRVASRWRRTRTPASSGRCARASS